MFLVALSDLIFA